MPVSIGVVVDGGPPPEWPGRHAGLCLVNYMPIGRGSDDAKDVRCARSGDGAIVPVRVRRIDRQLRIAAQRACWRNSGSTELAIEAVRKRVDAYGASAVSPRF
jgi:hypothetical protein